MYRAVAFAALALALVAGCRAELLDNGGDNRDKPVDAPTSADDSSTLVDAAVAVDAPVDARLCAGGDARATAPDGSCVVYFGTPRTFADASTACTLFGARMLIIKDAGTDEVARTLAGLNDVYIGLTDLTTEGTFLWVDNSAATYTNWYPGEPNNAGNVFQEDCALVNGRRGGQWDDRPCAPDPDAGVTGSYPYLCQF